MVEPMSTLVGALVSLFTAYTNYKVGMAQTKQHDQSTKEKSTEVQLGEQIKGPLREAIEQYGNNSEQQILAKFEENPAIYSDRLKQTMIDLAQRDHTFAAVLRDIAQRENLLDQDGKVHIHVEKGQVFNKTIGSTVTINNKFE